MSLAKHDKQREQLTFFVIGPGSLRKKIWPYDSVALCKVVSDQQRRTTIRIVRAGNVEGIEYFHILTKK